MGRLTDRSPKNNLAYLTKVKPNEQIVESPYPDTLRAILESFQQLAAYEDIQFDADGNEVITLDHLRKLVQAEKDGLCVVLPCKVGDTVYLTVHGYVEETKVRTFFIGHPSYNRGEPDPRYEMVRCTNCDIPLKDFERTIFLTHPAAEAALEAQKGAADVSTTEAQNPTVITCTDNTGPCGEVHSGTGPCRNIKSGT